MPPKLSAVDLKILKELFDNARKSYSEISKNVHLSKEGVAYRIKRLQEKKLLSGFNAVIDVKKLGWESFLVYIRLVNVDTDMEDKILSSLKKNKNIAWLTSCIGNYDIILKLFAKNHVHADEIMKTIELDFGSNIDTYIIDHLVEDLPVPKTFLFPNEEFDALSYIKKGGRKEVSISNLDKGILKLLATQARSSSVEMAKKLKVSRELVQYHLKKLEKEKVILKYRPSVWFGVQDQGWNFYFVRLKLKKLRNSLENNLFTFLLTHKNVNYLHKTITIYH